MCITPEQVYRSLLYTILKTPNKQNITKRSAVLNTSLNPIKKCRKFRTGVIKKLRFSKESLSFLFLFKIEVSKMKKNCESQKLKILHVLFV